MGNFKRYLFECVLIGRTPKSKNERKHVKLNFSVFFVQRAWVIGTSQPRSRTIQYLTLFPFSMGISKNTFESLEMKHENRYGPANKLSRRTKHDVPFFSAKVSIREGFAQHNVFFATVRHRSCGVESQLFHLFLLGSCFHHPKLEFGSKCLPPVFFAFDRNACSSIY